MASIMVISPHPDDAELGMGGTIVRLIQQGHAVTIVDLTNGEPTPHGDEPTRASETAEANAALGNPRRINLGLPNRYLEATIASRVKLAEAIRVHAPALLFAPYHLDAHPDHLAACRLAIDARFTAKLTKTEMAGQPHYPRRLILYFCTHLMIDIAPSFVLDVSAQIEAKMAAIACYRSQFYTGRGDKAGAVPDMVRSVNRYFGQRIGAEYGEPFHCPEVLGLAGLGDLL